MTMSAVSIIIAMMGSGSFLSVANGQSQTTNNNNTAGAAGATKKPLPVLLIHGYASDASVWTKWEDLLKKDGIPFYPITFYKSDDKCGSAARSCEGIEHAGSTDSQKYDGRIFS